MSYTYYLSGSPPYFQNVNQQLVNGFNTALEQLFSQASDVWDITEETYIGSGSYIPTIVRIISPVPDASYTRTGDDYKILQFKPTHSPIKLGQKFYFNENYWLVTNTNTTKSLVNSVMVTRLNNTLRWVGEDGTIYYEHCNIGSELARPRDSAGAVSPVLPAGYLTVLTQMNERTVKIKGNQRFLFGSVTNRLCFKVFGDGVRSFLNQKTEDDESGQVLALIMGGNYTNYDTDDIVNGIADRYIDRGVINSGSSSGSYIVVTPNENYVLENATTNFGVNYYSGSTIQTGSFIFSVSGSNVPLANYTFTIVNGNNFSIKNNIPYLYEPLLVDCVGSSGSKVMSINLRGAW